MISQQVIGPGEHRFDDWNWSQQAQKLVTKEARIKLACFHNGKWLRICMFSYIGFSSYTCISPYSYTLKKRIEESSPPEPEPTLPVPTCASSE